MATTEHREPAWESIPADSFSAPCVTILHRAEKTPSEIHAAKIVGVMGGTVAFARLSEGGPTASFARGEAQGRTIIARAATLAASLPDSASAADWLASLAAAADHCFVFGFEADAASRRLLQVLTSGAFREAERPDVSTGRFAVAADQREICRQLSGIAFDAPVRRSDAVFVGDGKNADCAELIRLQEKPLVLSTRHGSIRLMLVAPGEVADLDEPIETRAPMPGLFSHLAPLLMFLRRACGERLWHNESARACFIIDDPLLKPRYGFLEFERLLSVMQQEKASTSIAFIPWNHRRSDARVTDLFRRFPSHLSLCVHGCDHTGGEFASRDVDFLIGQAARSLEWMKKHRELTDVEFDDVMVFPQGNFSTVAIKALQSCGYLAAVNSTGRPADGDGGSFQLRDLLEVAVTRFYGFPLFVRHYPDDIAGLAIDLFLGKPALTVEHHAYFRDGYEPLAANVRALKTMEPRLEWTNLSTVCSRASSVRTADNGDLWVRFYTDRFRLSNETSEPQRYILQHQSSGRLPARFKLNGSPVNLPSDGVLVRLVLAAGQSADVDISREAAATGRVSPPGFVWRAGVFVRRYLSEFRDNHVDRNPSIKRVASHVRHRLAGVK